MDKQRISRLLLTLAATGFFLACGSGETKKTQAGPVVSGVRLQTVRLEGTPLTFEAVGTVRSANTSVLAAQLSGTVREVRVKTGDRVRSGQVLAILDDRSPRAQLDAAQAGVQEAKQGLAEVEQALAAATAQRQFAEATFKRYQALLQKNSLSQQEFDGALATYKGALANERALEAKKEQLIARGQQARSQENSAQTMFSYSRIVSPVDGVVTAKSVDAGTVVMPGTPLLTVEETSHYRLEASLASQYLADVKPGETVSVTTEHGQFEGRVAEIVPAADSASRTFTVKIDLPRDCQCRSGEYGKAGFTVGEERRMVVPRAALVEYGELEGLYVVDPEGKVEYRLVKTGKSFGDSVEIVSGLSDGERIAVSNIDRLRDGARVEG
jgi:multidrug efflux system membrane fusion protein